MADSPSRPRPGSPAHSGRGDRGLGTAALAWAMALALALSAREACATCPSSCATPLGFTYIGSPAPAVTVPQDTISKCRRACYVNNYPFYVYNTDRKCSCYRSCTSTVNMTEAVPASIGMTALCSDAICPTDCATPASTTYIFDPKPTYTGEQPNIQACRSTCYSLAIGPYYGYDDEKTCSCYGACTYTEPISGAVPVRVGYIPSCSNLPRTRKRCSAYSYTRIRKCPGRSRVGTSVDTRLRIRYQCCCPYPNIPVVRQRQLVNCKARPSSTPAG